MRRKNAKSSLENLHYFIKRTAKYAFYDLWRNKLLTLATVVIMAIMIIAFNVILGLYYIADGAIYNINQKVDINIDILDESDEFRIQGLITDLQAMPEVNSVIYVSKEEAMESFVEYFPDSQLVDFLEEYEEENPLPASIQIITRNIYDNPVLLKKIEETSYTDIIDLNKFYDNVNQYDKSQVLLSITNLIYEGGWFISVFFIAIAIVTIFNAITVIMYTHEREIEIMKLVGARYRYIKAPFLFAGAIYGFLATFLAMLVIQSTFGYIENNLLAMNLDSVIRPLLVEMFGVFYSHSFSIYFVEMIVIMLLGLASSYVAIVLHLRKQNI